MGASHRLSLIGVLVALSSWQAVAQVLPWPGDPQRPGPAAGGAPAAPGTMTPMTMPGGGSMGGSMGGGFPGGPPMGGGGFGGGAEPSCMPEFTKLREDFEKKGRAAKAVMEHKPSREEACKQIMTVYAAEAKWVKFTEANVAGCGIPRGVADQLKTMHEHTEQLRKNVCAPGPAAAAGPSGPSLSDALGTSRLPVPETTKSGGGSTLDTLSGNVLQK
jgi:hypothetical protein